MSQVPRFALTSIRRQVSISGTFRGGHAVVWGQIQAQELTLGKTTLAISLLALLSVVIFAQSATAAAHKVVIAVDASGTPTVDSDRATLSVSSGDTVVWVPSQGISGFSVVFDSGSPFSRSKL